MTPSLTYGELFGQVACNHRVHVVGANAGCCVMDDTISRRTEASSRGVTVASCIVE